MSTIDSLSPAEPSMGPQEPSGPTPTAKVTSSELDDAKQAGLKLLTELKNFGAAASKLAVKTVKDMRTKSRA